MLADRSDISEEIQRLTIHADQLEVLFKCGGEIGKRLDFLLQEMNRKTNTVLQRLRDGGTRSPDYGPGAGH